MKNRRVKQIVCLAAILSLAGCAQFGSNVNRNASDPLFVGSKLHFQNACNFSPKPDIQLGEKPVEAGVLASLALSLAPEIAAKITDFAAAFLERRGREYSATASQATHVSLKRGSDPVLGCLIYVAGKYGPAQSQGSGKWNADMLSKFGLASPPKIYAEWWIHHIDEKRTHIALRPGSVQLLEPISKRTSAAGRKDVAFAIQFSQPAPRKTALPSMIAFSKPGAPGSPVAKPTEEPKQEESGQPVAGFLFTFPELKVGAVLEARELSAMASEAQAVAVPEASALPLNVQVTVVETEDGGDLLLKFSKFLSDNKAKINPEVESLLRKLINGSSDKKK